MNLPPGINLLPIHVIPFMYSPIAFYTWLRNRFGPIVTIGGPNGPIVMALTADGAKQILTSPPLEFEAFQKEAFSGLAGDFSLFVMENDEHRNERHLLLPSFHGRILHKYASDIMDVMEEYSGDWKPGYRFRAADLMLNVSRNVILSIVFGQDYDFVKGPGNMVLRRLLASAHPTIEYLSQLQKKWFPIYTRFARTKRDFVNFAEQAIVRRRTFNNEEAADVLDVLLLGRNVDGSLKTNPEVIDELYTILLPGHATTGVAISWVLYEVYRHQEILEKLQFELDSLGEEPDPMKISKLPYLDAVCNESMRLHTIVTETARKTAIDKEIFGLKLPRGIGLGVSMTAIHHDPELYPEPSMFNPDRFLDREFSSFEFMPFGGGHRRCLGAALSDYEVRLIVGHIVSNWDLKILTNEKEKRHNLGMGPKHGVHIEVIGRRNRNNR